MGTQQLSSQRAIDLQSLDQNPFCFSCPEDSFLPRCSTAARLIRTGIEQVLDCCPLAPQPTHPTPVQLLCPTAALPSTSESSHVMPALQGVDRQTDRWMGRQPWCGSTRGQCLGKKVESAASSRLLLGRHGSLALGFSQWRQRHVGGIWGSLFLCSQVRQGENPQQCFGCVGAPGGS